VSTESLMIKEAACFVALRNSPAAPSGRIWKLPQMSGKVRRNVNIVNHQPVSCELAMSLWSIEFNMLLSRTNTVPVEEMLVIFNISGQNMNEYGFLRPRIWGYTSKKSLYRGEQHLGHTNPFIFRYSY